MTDQEEIELHMIVNELEDKAKHEKINFNYLQANLYEGWVNEIIDGGASIKEARQMLKAANMRF